MSNHRDVANHLRRECGAARATAKVQLDAAVEVERMAGDYNSWKVASRQALMTTIQAAHSCLDPACPLDDWQDELPA